MKMTSPLWRAISGGLKSLFILPPIGTGGTVSARYCYSVFMRHRVIAAQNGMSVSPNVILELGPGDSLGIGLMALLTGAKKYIAIDTVRHASVESNLAVFDELVLLLKDRSPIFFDNECAKIKPELSNYEFPRRLFNQDCLRKALSPRRLNKIKQALLDPYNNDLIEYIAPMGRLKSIPSCSIDWVFSQAVLEHIDNLEETYQECFRCLKQDGVMTHQIDYQSHETASEWNGHWKYPQWLWIFMRGRRPWFLNRLPHSVHSMLQKKSGFYVTDQLLQKNFCGIGRAKLASNFKTFTDQDMVISSAMIVSSKDRYEK